MTRTILIADDDAGARSFLQSVLEKEGCDVVHAVSREEALASGSSRQIDGVFLDLEQIGLCRALRGMPQHRNTPIIFLTDKNDDDALEALSILESARLKHSDLPDEMRRFGIGIHAGRAVIGNIGSPEHLDYSAIGSTVNLAARLCGQAQAMSIAVSKAVRDAATADSRLNFHSKREVVVRGIKDRVTVYTLSMR
jgi:class 3 adenylate cyclase